MLIKRVYWDACVFHALFSKEANRFEVCMELEKQARENKLIIYTSTATFVECVWLKENGKTVKLNKENDEIITKYFKHKFIQPINLDRTLAEAARALLWQFETLKSKDAIHVACAISQMVDELHTFDDYLLKLSGKVGVSSLKICKPEMPPKKEPDSSFDPPTRRYIL